ncbi:MAG: 16S rRNA (guanine(527)-N(7))-methyltransferase RsmG [Bacteroidota bacterium]|nr:16S rRNA (guanine(527)-N(7))-methyltransferase RsmG [Bacteroidota bacterium]
MEIIKKYFPDLDEVQLKRLEALQQLYAGWNEKINVISRKDIGQLYIRHVLHSLAIARYVQFARGTKILDAGTGGGFPGIPLAIFFPHVDFLLVDSIGKKIGVVKEIAASLELKNVEARNERVEKISGSFDFVVSRAVKSLPVFYAWVKNKIRKDAVNEVPNGILYLKGGDFADEMDEVPLKHKIIELTDYFEEDFFETKKLLHLFRR